jgi:hypothetical protein
MASCREANHLRPATGRADQAFGENLLENVNEAHKYVLPLSTPPATLPIILGFAF